MSDILHQKLKEIYHSRTNNSAIVISTDDHTIGINCPVEKTTENVSNNSHKNCKIIFSGSQH